MLNMPNNMYISLDGIRTLEYLEEMPFKNNSLIITYTDYTRVRVPVEDFSEYENLARVIARAIEHRKEKR